MTAPQPGWADPELADLFAEDPGLEETARMLRAARPEPVIDEEFQRRLRVQLMQAAAERPSRARGGARSDRSLRRPFWMRLRATHFAWGGLGAGVALAAATVVALLAGGQGQNHQSTIVATSPVAAQHLVSPTNTITVSFNQPMNHSAVESGLRIEPATEVTTAWQGNDLVITPVHHLAGNTPYTVTIAQPALLAASGARGTSPVQITFGTAPTPPVAGGTETLPSLSPTTLGPAQAAPLVLFSPDGGVAVNTGPPAAVPVSPSPSPSPSASPSPSPSPSPSAASSPSASPGPAITLPTLAPTATPTPAPASPALVEYPAHGAPTVLGPAATAAAFSPDGASLASAVPAAQGGSDILLSRADGTDRTTLTHSTAPVVALAWTTAAKVEFATAQAVRTVTTTGAVQTLSSPQGTVAALSPDGSVAYLTPSGGSPGRVFTFATGKGQSLTGAGATVAFSGDSSTLAWVDGSSSPARLLTTPLANGSISSVSVLDPGSQLGAIALSQDGREVAYTETLADGTSKLVLADLPTGAPLATGSAASVLAFSPQANALALLQGGEVGLAQIPGAASTSGPLVPAAASQVLHAFLDAQVRGDHSALSALSVPGLNTSGLLPSGISRASLIDSVAQSDGTVHGIATLVLDPSLTRLTTLVSDETLTVSPRGGSYVVSSLNASQLHPLAAGPHVISVNTSHQHGNLSVQVAFDSDLAPASLPGTVSVQQPSGATVPATVTYDANSRTVTVTVNDAPSGALSVVVSTALRDINGGSLAAPFTAPITGG